MLPILLLDSQFPLLADQPDDNLDNRFVYDTVVDSLRRIKQTRQLIFITHNPNIPVLGDAERVFVLESAGDACGTLSGEQQSSQATTSPTLVDPQGTSNSPLGAGTNAVVRTETPASDANQTQRRQWIVAQLRLLRKLRTPDIARELGCSVQTIRLDIEALRQAGTIEFIGPTKSGYYGLVR